MTTDLHLFVWLCHYVKSWEIGIKIISRSYGWPCLLQPQLYLMGHSHACMHEQVEGRMSKIDLLLFCPYFSAILLMQIHISIKICFYVFLLLQNLCSLCNFKLRNAVNCVYRERLKIGVLSTVKRTKWPYLLHLDSHSWNMCDQHSYDARAKLVPKPTVASLAHEVSTVHDPCTWTLVHCIWTDLTTHSDPDKVTVISTVHCSSFNHCTSRRSKRAAKSRQSGNCAKSGVIM